MMKEKERKRRKKNARASFVSEVYFFLSLSRTHIYCKEKTDQTGAFGRLKKKASKSHMQILYNGEKEEDQ